ncbi:MAG TPA: DMT family transporter [Bacillota bacterium]|jgi:drug/metabolite transporter (DMT)-like permease
MTKTQQWAEARGTAEPKPQPPKPGSPGLRPGPTGPHATSPQEPVAQGTTALATGAILLAVTFWGLSYMSTKVALREVPPTTIGVLRFAISTAILWLMTRWTEPASRLRRADLPRIILGGLLSVTIYFYFQNAGIQLTSASSASLIVALIPIVTIILDVLVFRTRLSALRVLGVVAAIIGSYLVITSNGRIDLTSTDFRGNLFLVAAVLAWSGYTLLMKAFSGAYSSLFLTAQQNLWGTVFLIPLAFFERHEWRAISMPTFGHLLFLGIFCGAVAYLCYNVALARLDVAATTLYLNLVPVIGVLSGYLILREAVGPAQLFGGAIIIVGILMVSWTGAARAGRQKRAVG